MYSSTMDLWKFTHRLMKSELLDIRKTAEIFDFDYYGYGWGIRDFNGIKAYGHYGAMNGFVGSLTYLPEQECKLPKTGQFKNRVSLNCKYL